MTGGDTGISAGIKDDLAAVLGQCRAVFLFHTVQSPGNTAQFELGELAKPETASEYLVGIRLMHVELTGQLEYKHLTIQKCKATLGGGIADEDQPPGENTTVYTPLILIE